MRADHRAHIRHLFKSLGGRKQLGWQTLLAEDENGGESWQYTNEGENSTRLAC